MKGANGVRYGSDAIAGMVLVEAKALRYHKGINTELHMGFSDNGKMGITSVRTDACLGFLPRVGLRLQGTLRRGGNGHSPQYYLGNTGIAEYNFAYTIGYKSDSYGSEMYYSQYNADIGILSGAHIGNLSDLQTAIQSPVPLVHADFSYTIGRPRQRAEHELLKWSNRIKLHHLGSLTLDLSRQFNRRSEYDARRPYNDSLAQSDPPQSRLRLTTYSADLVFEHRPIKKWGGSMGISQMIQDNTYAGAYIIPNYQSYNSGLWLIERYKYQHFEVEMGLRYDLRYLYAHTPNPTQAEQKLVWHNLSFSSGIAYRPNDHWRLSLHSGLAWRPPHPSELYSNGIHHGAASFEIGNPNLQPEQAINTIATAHYQQQQWQFDVHTFANYIHQYIYLYPSLPPTLTIRGAFPTFRYDQTNALLVGIDASANIALHPQWHIHAKTSLLRATNLLTRQNLPLMPPAQIDGGISYNIKDHKQRHNTYLKLNMLFVAKSNYNDTLDYAPPPPAYCLLNASAGIAWHIGKHQLNLTLQAQNINNTSYRNYLNRQRYFADEIGRNLSLKVRWIFN